jgi:large conductance mechanosensitive channel
MKTFLDEFKAFAMRGNVVDLAIAVVIGGAFGKIVSSLVDDIIMPIIGVLTGGMDFSHLTLTLKKVSLTGPAVTLNYGMFINNILTFLIVAFAIFIAMKQMNRFMKKEAEKPAESISPSKEEMLLTEIRDLLKK